jgi:hypothetical protein
MPTLSRPKPSARADKSSPNNAQSHSDPIILGLNEGHNKWRPFSSISSIPARMPDRADCNSFESCRQIELIWHRTIDFMLDRAVSVKSIRSLTVTDSLHVQFSVAYSLAKDLRIRYYLSVARACEP